MNHLNSLAGHTIEGAISLCQTLCHWSLYTTTLNSPLFPLFFSIHLQIVVEK